MIEVITSFNEYYYDLIGKDSVDSWLKNWDKQFKLTCYVEEFRLPFKNSRIKQIDFAKLDSDYNKLQQEDLHRSIKRFAKKAYSFMHAMHHSKSQWIIWLDADVITTQQLDNQIIQSILNPYHLSTYMGVNYTTDKSGNSGQWLVPETGFFAINTHNIYFEEFRAEYCRRYHKRDFADLRRFYDNDVFGAAINSVPDALVTDLCQGFTKPYKTPLRHTVLGPYLNHYKAKHSKHEYNNRDELDQSLLIEQPSNSQYEDE